MLMVQAVSCPGLENRETRGTRQACGPFKPGFGLSGKLEFRLSTRRLFYTVRL